MPTGPRGEKRPADVLSAMPSKSCTHCDGQKKPTNCNHGPDVSLAISQKTARAWISGTIATRLGRTAGRARCFSEPSSTTSAGSTGKHRRLDPAAVKPRVVVSADACRLRCAATSRPDDAGGSRAKRAI